MTARRGTRPQLHDRARGGHVKHPFVAAAAALAAQVVILLLTASPAAADDCSGGAACNSSVGGGLGGLAGAAAAAAAAAGVAGAARGSRGADGEAGAGRDAPQMSVSFTAGPDGSTTITDNITGEAETTPAPAPPPPPPSSPASRFAINASPDAETVGDDLVGIVDEHGVTHNPDGSITVPDGKGGSTTTTTSGIKVIVSPDGTTTVINGDTTTVYDGDGNLVSQSTRSPFDEPTT